MIKVTINYVQEIVHDLEVKGHAKSAEYGKDLVCAGVSSIITGALNALDAKDFNIMIQEGLVRVNAKKEVSQHDAIVLETLIVQLRTMEESYPQFIKIIK